MNKSEFLQDVEAEIRNIKAIATKEELGRLNFETFKPEKPDQCIYGQLTHDCSSERAKEIMSASCKRVMDFNLIQNRMIETNTIFGRSYEVKGMDLEVMVEGANGVYESQPWNHPKEAGMISRYRFMSLLEAYIQSAGANNAGILAWLKGETEEFPVL